MRLVDIHCHYEDERFDGDRIDVLKKLLENGIIAIDAGCSVSDSEKVMMFSHEFENIWFCAGVHPENANTFNSGSIEALKKLWNDEKCVGVGEIGLDYHWDNNPEIKVQRDVFALQVHASKQAELPVVIHNRDATGDMLDMIKSEHISHGVMHCFSESTQTAKVCLDAGLYFSFGGTSTFKNAKRAVENLKYIPKDRILLETDSPYLAPEPVRGTRNSSLNLIFIAQNIAKIWGVDSAEVIRITQMNAKALFGKMNY